MAVSDKHAARHALAVRVEAARQARDAAQQEWSDAIVAAFDGGLPVTEIAEAAGIHRSRVYQIVRSSG